MHPFFPLVSFILVLHWSTKAEKYNEVCNCKEEEYLCKTVIW